MTEEIYTYRYWYMLQIWRILCHYGHPSLSLMRGSQSKLVYTPDPCMYILREEFNLSCNTSILGGFWGHVIGIICQDSSRKCMLSYLETEWVLVVLQIMSLRTSCMKLYIEKWFLLYILRASKYLIRHKLLFCIVLWLDQAFIHRWLSEITWLEFNNHRLIDGNEWFEVTVTNACLCEKNSGPTGRMHVSKFSYLYICG